MKSELCCLGNYTLQNDMRIRLPKTLLSNLPIECGKTTFDVYVDKTEGAVILKIKSDSSKIEETGV